VLLILLNAGANVNARVRSFGNITPLHSAVKKRHQTITSILMIHGARAELYCTANYQTPYHWAAVIGDMQCPILMNAFGIDMSFRTNDQNGYHCIHLTSTNGHTSVVRWFIEKRVPVDIVNNYGFTPLHMAAYFGHYDVVELLLERKAQVNIRADHSLQNMALDLAAYQGHYYLLQMLLNAGADVNAADSSFKFTPINYAVKNNNLECLTILANYGGNLNIHMGSEHGESLMVTAAKNDSDVPADWLINVAAIPYDRKDKDGLTPLHHASMCGSQNVTLLLLAVYNDINIISSNAYKMTPLHYAVFRGHVNVVILLSLFGADFNVQSSDKLKPLHYSAMTGDLNSMQVMVATLGHQPEINKETFPCI
jgi:ankyrin repeat protein